MKAGLYLYKRICADGYDRILAIHGRFVISESGGLIDVDALDKNRLVRLKLETMTKYMDDENTIHIENLVDGIFYLVHFDLDIYIAKGTVFGQPMYMFFVKQIGSDKEDDFVYAPHVSKDVFFGTVRKIKARC